MHCQQRLTVRLSIHIVLKFEMFEVLKICVFYVHFKVLEWDFPENKVLIRSVKLAKLYALAW